MEKPLNNTKNRGTALEVFIVISFISSVYSIYSGVSHPFPVPNYLPTWFPQFLIILYVLNILALIGIWLYKKWTVYLFVTVRLISWAIMCFNLSSYQTTSTRYTWIIPYMFTIIIALVLMFDGIFFWLLYKKRILFR